MTTRSRHPSRRQQGGFTLIEILVSILIFAFGILGLVGLQATSIKLSTDAQQRAEATFLADQLLARMLISNPATASTFAHNATATACDVGTAASANATVTEWLGEVTATFPLALTTEQQIIVNGDQVTVRLCWRNGASDAVRSLAVSNRIQWQ